MNVLIGLDLSLRSPGYATYRVEASSWNLYAHQQTKRHSRFKGGVHVGRNRAHTVRLLPPIPVSSSTPTSIDVARYIFLWDQFEEHVLKPLHDAGEVDVRCILEGYAYAKVGTGFSYKLHELGGVFKTNLHRKGIQFVVTQPSAWKRILRAASASQSATRESSPSPSPSQVAPASRPLHASGQKGSLPPSTKHQAMRLTQSQGVADLYDLFGIKASQKTISNPAQDLADATSLVVYGLNCVWRDVDPKSHALDCTTPNVVPTKKRKRGA